MSPIPSLAPAADARGSSQSWWKAGWESMLGLFYPDVCQLCQAEPATVREGYVGSRCRQAVRWVRPPFCDRCGLPFPGNLTTHFECSNCQSLDLHFRFARAAVIANPTVREVIHRYKYQRHLWFEPFLVELLTREAAPVLNRADWDFIVPVPLFPLKEREREFNQAERIAQGLSRATGIPVAKRALIRTTATETQTHLNRAKRAENMHRAFAVARREMVQNRRLVLLDDVFTTGATTNDCARALKAAGAGEVCVWTVARGI